jgi:hypothetical protein
MRHPTRHLPIVALADRLDRRPALSRRHDHHGSSVGESHVHIILHYGQNNARPLYAAGPKVERLPAGGREEKECGWGHWLNVVLQRCDAPLVFIACIYSNARSGRFVPNER